MKPRTLVVFVATIALSGCAAGRPSEFLLVKNQLTYEEGERLLAEGEAFVQQGESQIDEGRDLKKRGDQLMKKGRETRKQGEEISARGRKALRAARMLEESEKLGRRGENLRHEALTE